MEEEDQLHELAKKATLNFNPMSPLHKKVKERLASGGDGQLPAPAGELL